MFIIADARKHETTEHSWNCAAYRSSIILLGSVGSDASIFPRSIFKIELTRTIVLLSWLSREKRDSFTLECVLCTFWDCKLAQFCPA